LKCARQEFAGLIYCSDYPCSHWTQLYATVGSTMSGCPISSCLRPKQQFANHSSFRLCPANESKIVLPHVRDDYGQNGIYRDEEGSRLGECAPIPRGSFVVPSNGGLPSSSKLVAPGASRGMGTSRSSRARSLLRGLRQPDTRPTTGNIGKNCGAGQVCLRLVGRAYRSYCYGRHDGEHGGRKCGVRHAVGTERTSGHFRVALGINQLPPTAAYVESHSESTLVTTSKLRRSSGPGPIA
jgi:hypothetical protein